MSDVVTSAYRLHWWRFSVPSGPAVADVQQQGIEALGGQFGPPEKRGNFNQPWSVEHVGGARVYYGSPRDDQPIVVECSGDACDRVPTAKLVEWCQTAEGRVTRVDVACDVGPDELARQRVRLMLRRFRRGECRTQIPATSCKLYRDHSPGGGVTVYVGSRKSDAFMRAYDRRGPMRIEWQWHPQREQRRHLANLISDHGVAALWRSLAQRCVWPLDWYARLLDGDDAGIEAPAAIEDDLQRFVAHLVDQYGSNFAALDALGLKLEDLAAPPGRLNARQFTRFGRWVAQAPAAGYDPAELNRKVQQWRGPSM